MKLPHKQTAFWVRSRITILKMGAFFGALAVIACLASYSVMAETAPSYGGGSVQAYGASAPIDIGTIVVLTGGSSNQVSVATQKEAQNMFGVVVDKNQLPIAISNGELQNETYVAASGTYNVLVSTQAGTIAAGDYLTLSSLNGVAMRAGEEEVTVFGRANLAFSGQTDSLGVSTLTDASGGKKTVKLGMVPVTIEVKSNPNHKSTDTIAPDFLKKIGQAIAEKEVSPIRLYLSMAITAVSLIAAIAVLYAGVRNSVISIGRNPMSKRSIFRALLEVVLTSLLVLIVGLFAVYLLLRL